MIKLSNISFSFHTAKGPKPFFHNLSLTIEKCERICLLGHNGSGKTSLLNLISGKIKPDQGQVFFEDQDVTSWPPYQRSKLLGYMQQNPSLGTIAHMSIYENIAFAIPGKLWNPLKSQKKRAMVSSFLTSLCPQLIPYIDKPVQQLSGGQKQLVALMMSTIQNRPLLLLDEISAALDPKAAQQVMTYSQNIVNKNNITSVLISHNIKEALAFATRILILSSGQIAKNLTNSSESSISAETLNNELLNSY